MKPKVLLYDLETAPVVGTTWGKYEQDVIWIIKDFHMLCFAYKWLGESKVHVKGLPDYPLYKKDPENDRELLKELHKLFNEADVIIAHNGDQFDQKIANARFMINKLGPTTPYKSIDTKKVAKRYARFTSNKLDDLGASLGLGQKLSTGGPSLWRDCMRGDPKAWRKMMRYNKQDVVLLEELYLELRPWIENHPNRNLLEGVLDKCPKCGGGPLTKHGFYFRGVAKIQVYMCHNCGGYPRSRLAEKAEKPMYV